MEVIIICDTREQKNQKILQYFDRQGIPYTKQKLETGDYMNSEKPDVLVERKQNLGELLKNLCTADQVRFKAEIRRAHKKGARFIILCEHGGRYKDIKDVAKYKDRFCRVPGRTLMEEMYKVKIGFDVEFLFCDKWNTGRKIAEVLGVVPP